MSQWTRTDRGYVTEASDLGWRPGEVRDVEAPCCGASIPAAKVLAGRTLAGEDLAGWAATCCDQTLMVFND